ncbi:MAG: orotate phosphoribosyltransferase [Bacteroidota bacterium]
MKNESVVADKLLQVRAVKLSPEQPFTWASGWKSPIYCDNRKMLAHPHERDFIKSELANTIFEEFPDAAVLAGVATAGIAWGAMAADQLKLPFCYVRPKPKDHGMGNQIEGDLTPGQSVVVVEDLISTGKSSLQVVEVLRNAGVQVVGMVALFTYGFPEADQAFEQAQVKLLTLSNYPALIDRAIFKGLITPEQQTILLEWSQNPSQWGQ